MAHVSQNPLPKETSRRLDAQLFGLLGSGKKAKRVFEEILSDTERLMLAKRIATIFMLIDEQSYYRIEQALGVSSSTSKRLHRMLLGGAFSSLEKMVADKRQREQVIEDIGYVLRVGLPPRAYVIKKHRGR